MSVLFVRNIYLSLNLVKSTSPPNHFNDEYFTITEYLPIIFVFEFKAVIRINMTGSKIDCH